MLRKLAAFASVALVVSAVGIAGAGAAGSPPPTGTLTCGATGTMTLKPGIPAVGSSTKALSAKIKNAVGSPCDNSGVTGGKASITGANIILNAKIAPGASCSTLLSGPPNVSKAVLVVKLQHTDPVTLKTFTVAVVKPVNLQFSQVGTGFGVTGTIPQTSANNKPFGGETFEAQLNVDNIPDALACIGGTTDLSHIDFSAAGGSGFSIHS